MQKKLAKHAAKSNTFEEIAREWYRLHKDTWVLRHADDVITSPENDVFPYLGNMAIRDINAADVYAVLSKVKDRSKEPARRIRRRIEAVFARAIAAGHAKDNPGAQVKKAKGKQPAITDLEEARAMLAKAEAEPAHPVTKLALRILALTAVRSGALGGTPWTEWEDLDPAAPVWRIPAERMKMRLKQKSDEARDHLVPLSRQAVEAIATLRTISGRGPLAFPNTRHAHKPMSENAVGYLLIVSTARTVDAPPSRRS